YTLTIQLAFPISSAFMMYALEKFGRIRTSCTAFVLATIFAVLFSFSYSEWMVVIVGFCMTFFVQLAGNSMQIFTSEVFPTHARASCFVLALIGGRLVSAFSVFIFPFLTQLGFGFVMTAIAVLLFIAAFSVTQISRETKGLALDAIAPPTR